jgi:hypothetical protein
LVNAKIPLARPAPDWVQARELTCQYNYSSSGVSCQYIYNYFRAFSGECSHGVRPDAFHDQGWTANAMDFTVVVSAAAVASLRLVEECKTPVRR